MPNGGYRRFGGKYHLRIQGPSIFSDCLNLSVGPLRFAERSAIIQQSTTRPNVSLSINMRVTDPFTVPAESQISLISEYQG